jgi:hypothetical protein
MAEASSIPHGVDLYGGELLIPWRMLQLLHEETMKVYSHRPIKRTSAHLLEVLEVHGKM